MRKMLVRFKWSVAATLSVTQLASACASRPTAMDVCDQPPSPSAVVHLAAMPDSVLVAARVGVLIVRVVPSDSSGWYPSRVNLTGSVDGPRVGVTHRRLLRATNTPGVLAADGLRAGEYELTVRTIGYVPSTDRITVRAGYADTVLATLRPRLICLVDPVIPSGGIFGGALPH